MFTNQEVGQRIHTRRCELGLTLQDVAKAIGVENSTILRYEKGRVKKIKLPVIESIASALHVSPAWIVGKTDDPYEGLEDDLQMGIEQSLASLGMLTADEMENFSLSAVEHSFDYVSDRTVLAFLLLGYKLRPDQNGQLRVTDLRSGKSYLLPRTRFEEGSNVPRERALSISNNLEAEKNRLYDLYQKADGRDQALVRQILSRYEDDLSRGSGDCEPDLQQ